MPPEESPLMNPSPRHPIGVPTQLFAGARSAVASLCRSVGLSCVRLSPNWPGVRFQDPADLAPERCRAVAAPFLAAGLSVACVSAGVNLMDPDLSRRPRGIQRLHALLRQARDFGTPYVVTETGSLSPNSPSERYAPNRSAAAWTELRLIVALAVEVAADHGVTLLLRADPAHVLASVDDALRLADKVNDRHLGFVMDPAGFLMDHQPEEWAAEMERLFERLGPLMPLAYAKDLMPDPGGVTLPRAGRGILDYRQFLRLLDRYQPTAAIILEHLRPDEVEAARRYVEESMNPV
jgi:sugar phosphate isomerase/epimerase